MAAARAQNVECSTHSGIGKAPHSSTGGRDVLFIVSESFTLSTYSSFLQKAVPRRENKVGLTEAEACKLESQGIPREGQTQGSDLSIMIARHKLDKRHRITGVLEGATCEQVTREIRALMTSTEKEGVAVYYIGHGKKESGDWCFSDGFFTFQDLIKLYSNTPNMHGRVLSVITDCSYSGHWVRQCMDFMDNERISPCGHSARERGVLIKVIASCQPSEVPKKLTFSVHSASNEKNHGFLSFSATRYKGVRIGDKQHPSGIDFTNITCSSSLLDSCTLTDGYSWKRWQEAQRIQLVSSVEQGQTMWYYVLLSTDEHKQAELKRKMASGKCCVRVTDYGRVLMKGLGERPSNVARDSIEREYLPVYK